MARPWDISILDEAWFPAATRWLSERTGTQADAEDYTNLVSGLRSVIDMAQNENNQFIAALAHDEDIRHVVTGPEGAEKDCLRRMVEENQLLIREAERRLEFIGEDTEA